MSSRAVLLVLLVLTGLVVAPVAPVASADHYCGEICIDYHQLETLPRCLYQKYVKHQPCG